MGAKTQTWVLYKSNKCTLNYCATAPGPALAVLAEGSIPSTSMDGGSQPSVSNSSSRSSNAYPFLAFVPGIYMCIYIFASKIFIHVKKISSYQA